MFARPCDVSRTHQGRLCKLLSRPCDSDQYRDSGSLSCPSSCCGPLLAVSPTGSCWACTCSCALHLWHFSGASLGSRPGPGVGG